MKEPRNTLDSNQAIVQAEASRSMDEKGPDILDILQTFAPAWEGREVGEWLKRAAAEIKRLRQSERYAWKNTREIDEERMRFRAALEQIRDYHVIQGMSPALFAEKVLGSPVSAENRSYEQERSTEVQS